VVDAALPLVGALGGVGWVLALGAVFDAPALGVVAFDPDVLGGVVLDDVVSVAVLCVGAL